MVSLQRTALVLMALSSVAAGVTAALADWVRAGGSVHWEAASDVALDGLQAFLDELGRASCRERV